MKVHQPPRPGGPEALRYAPSFADVTDFHALCAAARRAARGKRNAAAMAGLLFHLETVVLELQRELLGRTYRPRPYRTFTVSDPKPRAISAADPRDRVVHHALCAVLEPAFERVAVFDSYACRPGKGSHAAVARAGSFSRRYGYFLKMDFRKFFETVDHAVLEAALRRVCRDEGVLWLADTVIGHGAPGSPPGKGLPIGNLTSQHFAGFYLSPLDHHVKGALRVPGYVRYMDDLLLFGDDKRDLRAWAAAVGRFARERLLLAVKDEATVLAPTSEGVAFLGFRVFPGCVRLGGRARRRLVRAAREAVAVSGAGSDGGEGGDGGGRALALGSAFAHAAHADTLALRRSLVQDPGRGDGATRARTG